MDKMDKTLIDVRSDLRSLTNAEDGYIPLKPMSKVTIKINWQINPVYTVKRMDIPQEE